MDWRTRHEQHTNREARIKAHAHQPMADAAVAAFAGDRLGRLALDAALVRDLQMARAAGGRFGAVVEWDGVSE